MFKGLYSMRYWVVASFLLLSSSLKANTALEFSQFGVSDGLSQDSIIEAIKSRDGRIWIATQSGLNVFNGYETKIFKFNKNNDQSLVNDYIHALAEDTDGSIWIGTRKGVNKFKPSTQQFVTYSFLNEQEQPIENVEVSDIYIDSHGTIWCATWGQGIFHFNRELQAFSIWHPTDRTLPSKYVKTITKDKKGRIYIGFSTAPFLRNPGAGLLVLDKNGHWLNHYTKDNSELTIDHVSAIKVDSYNNVWIGTYKGGLYKISSGSEVVKAISLKDQNGAESFDSRVMAIAEDSLGTIWVGSIRYGITSITKDGHQQQYLHSSQWPTTINSNNISSILIDKDNYFFGTWDQGLNFASGQSLNFNWIRNKKSNPQSLPDEHVEFISEDLTGNLWMVVRNNGLVFSAKDSDTFTVLTQLPFSEFDISQDNLSQTHVLADGRLIVGITDGSLYLVDFKNKQTQYVNVPLANGAPLEAVNSDDSGAIWLGKVGGGVIRIAPDLNSYKLYEHDVSNVMSLSSNEIQTNGIFVDSKNNVWVSTLDKGLNLYRHKEEAFTRISSPVLTDNEITSFTELFDGLYAVSSKTNIDIIKLLPNGKVNYEMSLANALEFQSIAVNKLLFDLKSGLWISHVSGISNYNFETKMARHFNVVDGVMPSGYTIGSGTKLRDGSMLFSGFQGVVKFHPNTIDSPKNDIKIYFDKLFINHQLPSNDDAILQAPIHYTKALTLNHTHTSFSVNFAALEFIDPENVAYQYKLDGFDTEWIDTNFKRRLAHYTNIAPGAYTLRVRAKNKNASDYSEEKTLTIDILPAPWLSVEAKILYLFAIGLLAYLIWRNRIERHREQISHLTEMNQQRQRLNLALWGSGENFWEWKVESGQLTLLSSKGSNIDLKSIIHFDKESLRKSIHPDDVPTLFEAIDDTINDPYKKLEVTYRGKYKGGYKWLTSKGRVVKKGQSIQISGTTKDITDIKQKEIELSKLSTKLEEQVNLRTKELSTTLNALKQSQSVVVEKEKMAALGNVVVGLSHELNTPLGTSITAISFINAQISTIKKGLASNSLTKEQLKKGIEAIDQSETLVANNLTKVSKLVERFKDIAVEQNIEETLSFSVGAVIENVVTAIKSRYDERGLIIDIFCQPNIELISYPYTFSQVISQLIENAIEHNIDTQHALLITVKVELTASGIVVHLTDDGKGIDNDMTEKIFEPFYTTQRSSGRVGLGLHVLYNQVIYKLKGTIALTNATKGATFRIELHNL